MMLLSLPPVGVTPKISHFLGLCCYTNKGLQDVKLFVLQFGRKDPDSEESLAIRLILELMWIHRLRSTTPMGLNVFD